MARAYTLGECLPLLLASYLYPGSDDHKRYHDTRWMEEEEEEEEKTVGSSAPMFGVCSTSLPAFIVTC